MPLAIPCSSYQDALCRSCTQLTVPYHAQLDAKQAAMAALPIPADCWLAPVGSEQAGFRNKAKMVVMGSREEPVLGIQTSHGAVSLVDCPLYPAAFRSAFRHIAEFIRTAGLVPYDVQQQKGELKYILLTQPDASSGQWMLRFVLRSQNHLASIRKHLPQLLERWPSLAVCSVNIQPVHKAVLEGELEFILTDNTQLRVELNQIPLYLSVQSFFQTNTAVAAALYAAAKQWTTDLPVQRVWDLFCGVGGFALHLAHHQRQVTGIEISAPAIAAASQSAKELGVDIDFRALDATAFSLSQQQSPDLLVVNPPRRGLGRQLCQHIESLQPAFLLYSSCNPTSMAADFAFLPNYQAQKAQLFDMFPHTDHAEVLVLLRRR